MTKLTLSASQRNAILALIAGETMQRHAIKTGRSEQSVNQDICRARNTNGLTTYQLVARLAVEMANAERVA